MSKTDNLSGYIGGQYQNRQNNIGRALDLSLLQSEPSGGAQGCSATSNPGIKDRHSLLLP